MSRIIQTRDAEFSVFQSAIDQIAVQGKAGGAQSLGEAMTSTTRPGTEDPMVRQAALLMPEVDVMRAATGYFDQGLGGPSTHLAPEQAVWLKDKMDNNSGRKTVLMSHHQLFSNQEEFDSGDGRPKGATNLLLLDEVEPILPKVNLWLWGHQHEFVAYKDPRVRGRCMGHGGYPVGITGIGRPATAIPLDPAIAPQQKGKNFWDNGYALIELNGANAKVTYYAVDENGLERGTAATQNL